jgi:hypothetical protein
MTFELVSTAIPAEAIDETAVPYSVPFGRTGCAILPNGDYLVTVYWDSTPSNDLIKLWKIEGTTGAVLGELSIDTGGDADGRAHVIPLDGNLVQLLYMTGTAPGGKSYVVDCSGDDPTLEATFDDDGFASAYNGPVGHIYLRGIGVVAVVHSNGTSLYRRGRHVLSRDGGDANGLIAGPWPHPTDPSKFAVWFWSATAGLEAKAWEMTVTDGDYLDIAELGIDVLSATAGWVVGAGNPYAADPLVLQEMLFETLTNELDHLVVTDTDNNALYTDPDLLGTPVALASEGFWNLGAWGAPIAETANELFIGSAPRLSTDDDATSYAHIGASQAAGTVIAVTLAPLVLPAGEGLVLEVRMRIPQWSHSTTVEGLMHVATAASSTPAASAAKRSYNFERNTWEQTEFVYFPYTSALAAALAAGAVIYYRGPTGDTTFLQQIDIGYIQPYIGQGYYGINADPVSIGIDDSVEKFAYAHELWRDPGGNNFATPVQDNFVVRAGIVTAGSPPTVEEVVLEYGVTTPDGYPEDMNNVSLITGSMSMDHRNGETVIATCIVQQDGANDYYSVVVWKLTGGQVSQISGLDGAWRLGIDNGHGDLNLLSTDGWLQEASEVTGVDAPAQPVSIKTSDGWRVLGRFTTGAANETVYVARNFNDSELWPGQAYGTTVGTNPLDTYDGDTGYIQVSDTSAAGDKQEVTFDLAWESGPIPPTTPVEGMELSFDIGYKVISSDSAFGGLELYNFEEDGSGVGVASWLPLVIDAATPGDYQMTLRRGTNLGRDGDDETPLWYSGDFISEGPTIERLVSGSPTQHFSFAAYRTVVRVTYFRARLRWGHLPEPTPPETLDITYTLTDINADLAAAQTLAGATYGPFSGRTWGPLVAQSVPAVAADLADSSDATTTTLVQATTTAGSDLPVFTARFDPSASVPVGALPVGVAMFVRGRATTGTDFTWRDLLVGVGTSQAAVRQRTGTYNLALSCDLGPALKSSHYGITKGSNATSYPADHPGAAVDAQVQEQTLDGALRKSNERAAAWWSEKMNDPAFYAVVHSASLNAAQGDSVLAELSFTVRYLVP